MGRCSGWPPFPGARARPRPGSRPPPPAPLRRRPALTDPLSIALAAAAVTVGLAAGFLASPRPPELDGERLFKLALATGFLGEVDRANGTAEDWERRVRDWVSYHPAGRLPEEKLTHPERYKPPGEALDGELALVGQLAARATVGERVRWMYREAEAGLEARMVDPVELGAQWDLSRWLGPDASWDSLAAWSVDDRRFADAVSRQLDATWVLVGLPESLATALAAEVTAEVTEPAQLSEVMGRLTRTPEERVILCFGGDAGIDVLDVVSDEAGMRDRILAILAVGVPIWGRAGAEGPLSEGARRDWMDAHFRHERLDTEAQRLTPYCALQWLDFDADPPGADGVGLGQARFGPPGGLEEAPRIESVDLGPVPVGIDVTVLARALVATIGVLVLSKR